MLRHRLSATLALACALLLVVPANARAEEFQLKVSDSELHVFSAAEIALIDSTARAAIAEVRALLPELPKNITLLVSASREVLEETGDGAAATAPGEIQWTVDPARAGGVSAVVRGALRKTMFHELHHLARQWTVRGGLPISGIMDAVVSEGLATAFARDYVGFNASFAAPPPDGDAWFLELRALPPSAMANYLDWMIQHPDGRYRIGYRTGTYVVDRAMRQSKRPLLEFTTISTAELLRLAYRD